MGSIRYRRLRRRRTRQEIETARARWELFFFCWASFLACGLATVQALEAILALIESRPPRLVVPIPGI